MQMWTSFYTAIQQDMEPTLQKKNGMRSRVNMTRHIVLSLYTIMKYRVKYEFTVHVSRSTVRNRSDHIHTPGWAWFRSGHKKPDVFSPMTRAGPDPSIVIPGLYIMSSVKGEKKLFLGSWWM